MLKADGHAVKEAHDGKQGVDMAAVEKFDPILMDMSGPVLDGRSATRQIRQGNGASSRACNAVWTGWFPETQDGRYSDQTAQKSDLLIAWGAEEHAPLPRSYVLGGPCPYGRNL
jgi:CheY-like chemotaxis protein